jgi:hypothetical protein
MQYTVDAIQGTPEFIYTVARTDFGDVWVAAGADEPGSVVKLIWNDGDPRDATSDIERALLESKPSNDAAVQVVLEAGKRWDVWGTYADRLSSAIVDRMTPTVAAES